MRTSSSPSRRRSRSGRAESSTSRGSASAGGAASCACTRPTIHWTRSRGTPSSRGAAPRVPAVGPAVHGDAPPGQVPNGPERAVPAHVEGPVTELAHHEEGQPHQRPVARRVPLDVAAERRLPALRGRPPPAGARRTRGSGSGPPRRRPRHRRRGHEVVVARGRRDRRCRHRWILPAHLYHGPGGPGSSSAERRAGKALRRTSDGMAALAEPSGPLTTISGQSSNTGLSGRIRRTRADLDVRGALRAAAAHGHTPDDQHVRARWAGHTRSRTTDEPDLSGTEERSTPVASFPLSD